MLCCPRCRSLAIYVEAGGYTGNIYHCKKCGYRGALVLEVDEKEVPKGTGANTDTGDG